LKPEYRQNQSGGSLGGRSEKTRLSFADYEGLRVVQEFTSLTTVPTALERTGDFSELLPSTLIYDPTTGSLFRATRLRMLADRRKLHDAVSSTEPAWTV